MAEDLKNCWEIKNCQRHKGGSKVSELGECVASAEKLGHSCWIIAGTLCGGVIQGTFAQKEQNCIQCEVYKLYHRQLGSKGSQVRNQFAEEDQKYNSILMDRFRKC